ncbi:MAG: heavy-metal-associated domain-containing protein [Pseudonocardiales bacterium]|nr:heavy-metal-associated domain-containing protein [Pseudonocardiales bacterium]
MYLETVVVTGLHCEYCVKSVTEEIAELDGVSVLDVDLASGLVIFVSEEPVDQAELREAVELAGYRLVVAALS